MLLDCARTWNSMFNQSLTYLEMLSGVTINLDVRPMKYSSSWWAPCFSFLLWASSPSVYGKLITFLVADDRHLLICTHCVLSIYAQVFQYNEQICDFIYECSIWLQMYKQCIFAECLWLVLWSLKYQIHFQVTHLWSGPTVRSNTTGTITLLCTLLYIIIYILASGTSQWRNKS